MKEKHYLNLSFSMQLLFLFLLMCIVTTGYFIFNNARWETSFITGTIVLCSLDLLSLMCVLIFGFYSVVIEDHYICFNKIFKKTKIQYSKIEHVSKKRKAMIKSIIFTTVQFEELLVICEGSKKIELPLSLFDYDEINKKIVLRKQGREQMDR